MLLYQFATASDLAGWLVERPETLLVNYHNITPPDAFAPWDNTLARHQVQALGELDALARRGAGGGRLGVEPGRPGGRRLRRHRRGAPGGRPARQVAGTGGPRAGGRGAGRALAHRRPAGPEQVGRGHPGRPLVARADHDPATELTVIGRPAVPAYAGALRRYAAELGVGGAAHFVGHVDDAALDAAYAAADVLVVASEHEGFCLPVVEAMARGLPVVAYRQGALPEVLGDAGTLLETKDPATLAAAAHRLGADRRGPGGGGGGRQGPPGRPRPGGRRAGPGGALRGGPRPGPLARWRQPGARPDAVATGQSRPG